MSYGERLGKNRLRHSVSKLSGLMGNSSIMHHWGGNFNSVSYGGNSVNCVRYGSNLDGCMDSVRSRNSIGSCHGNLSNNKLNESCFDKIRNNL